MLVKYQIILKLILWVIFSIGLGGCVGEQKPATKAQCPSGFSFDSVSRKCFSAAQAPVATLSSLSVLENSGNNTVELTYSDDNGDRATGCFVTNEDPARIEVSSPRIYELSDESLSVLSRVNQAYNIISPTAMSDRDTAVSAVENLRRETSLTVVLNARDIFIDSARAVAQAALDDGGAVAAATGQVLMAEVEDYEAYFSRLENRCHCVSGKCETVLVPRQDQIGNSGFNYRIVDSEAGTGASQQVSVTINPETKRPLPVHHDVSVNESVSSTPLLQTFPAVAAAQTYSFSPNYFVVNATSQGTISNCFSPTSLPGTCSYTPFDGDMSDEYIGANNPRGALEDGEFATLNLQSLDYTALFKGEAGNNLRIQYSEYLGIGHPPELSVRVFSDSLGPIIDVVVVSNLTTADEVRQAINNPSNLSSDFVNAVLPGSDIAVTAVSETALSGGENAQDTFTYRVCEGMVCSDYDGVYTIRVLEQDDLPVVDVDNSSTTPDPVLEDGPFTFNLNYTDTDSSLAASACSVVADAPSELSVTSACSCTAGVCTAQLLGASDFFGESSVTVDVTNDGETSLSTGLDFDLVAVNDEPIFREFLSTNVYSFTDENIDENDGVSLTLGNEIYQSVDLLIDRGDQFTVDFEDDQEITMEIEILYTDDSFQNIIPQTSEFIDIQYNGTSVTDPDTDDTDPVTATIPLGAGVVNFTLTPDAFKDTSTTNDLKVIVRLIDDGGSSNGGDDRLEDEFVLTVNDVDFPPEITQKDSATIENVETNEGGNVYSAPFIVTEGGLSVEPNQQIQVQVNSDNTSLLPNENIEIYYDENDNDLPDAGPTEYRGDAGAAPVNLETPATEASGNHALILRLRPKAGESGTSNVTITVFDGGGNQDEVTFALIVHPVSAIHGGWANIKAVSNKVYDRGQLDPQRVCEASQDKCDGGQVCEGSVAPNSTVSADEVNAIYFDSTNERCYHATSPGVASWRELNTFCEVTSSADNSNCSGASCLGTNTPSIAPTEIDQFFFDYNNQTCFRSMGTTDQNDWEVYFPSKVTLEWNDFVLAGSGADSDALISGWNIYRREHGVPFDFSKPLNESPLPASTREYTDEEANYKSLYYYVVRPLDSKRFLPTATDDIFSEVRIATPPESMALVHRWMANLEVCEKMGRTLTSADGVDPSQNFRCQYNGPGAVDVGGLKYYDIQRDFFVDRIEVGCPFSRNSDAISTCGSNGCIGIGGPPATVNVDGLVYYDRSDGSCYVSNGVDTWEEVENTTFPLGGSDLIEKGMSALLPPLVNVRQQRAFELCGARNNITGIQGISGAMTHTLPSRREQIAYSAAPREVSDSGVADIERGLSLNSSSKCNSSFASGLESGYTNSSMPSTSFYFSLPGTLSSGIRSMTTGSVPIGSSLSTEACESQYGLQDVYGNVAEWVTERMVCVSTNCASAISSSGTPFNDLIDPSFTDNLRIDTSNYPFNDYALDGVLGPCRDVDSDGTCDAPMTEWEIQDKNHGASFFLFPMGLPLQGSYVFDNPPFSPLSDPADPNEYERISNTALEIGPSSGITNIELKNDAFIFNTAAIAEVSNGMGTMATGGGYKSERASGRYTLELVPAEQVNAVAATGGTLVSNNPTTLVDFVAQQPGADGNNISVGLITTTSPGTPNLDVSVSGFSITVEISDANDSTAQEIIDAIANNTQASNLVTASITGNASDTFSAQTGPFLTGGLDEVAARRNDIGLRCMVPLPPSVYDSDDEHNYTY